MKLQIVGLTAFLSVSVGAARVQAALDQSFDPNPPDIFAGVGSTDKAQTFTVGMTGTLTGVDVFIQRLTPASGSDDLLFDVRSTVGGVPIENDATTLASVVVPAASVSGTPGFFHIDISSLGVSVQAGDILAVVLRDPDIMHNGTDYGWYGQFQNPYSGGAAFIRTFSWGPLGDENSDLGFRTFVGTGGPACAVVRTEKDCYTPGGQVGFTITNTNCSLINLRNGGPWIIKDAQGNEVFRPACVTLAIIPLAQGGSASFSWDQLDEGTGQVGCNYASQAQVPNGTYEACVEYTNADFTVNDTTCATFEIDDDCIDDGSVPTVSGWGLAIIVVALLAALTIKFRRRPAPGG